MNEKNDNIQRFDKPYMEGLTEDEISLRQKQGLTNAAQEKITKTTGQIFKDNILTSFNAFNLIIGICLALVHAWVNMAYLMIIFLNTAIGIIQEIRAKKLVESLSLISALKATVIRGGKECEIPVDGLVLDDITVLRTGKQICSDSTVIYGEIEVNESLLTGEADPVLKSPGDALLSGSFVVSGKCYAKVEHVGSDNFVSKLAKGAQKHKKINSELMRSMRKVTNFTGFFIFPIAIFLFFESYFGAKHTLFDSVTSTAAALLGLLPKGLVLLISVSLVTGVIKLAKKKVLIQELYCIEMLARVDTLCLDKTGTITEGKMRVTNIYEFDNTSSPLSAEQAIKCFIGAMQDIEESNATFMALKERFAPEYLYEPVSKVAFSSQRKWSSVTFEDIGSFILGAPEVLSLNEEYKPPSNADAFATPFQKGALEQARNAGERVLFLGYCPDTITSENLNDFADINITPVASVGLSDPIRENAKQTLDFFKKEGVDVKIISGDNPLTVSSIAKQAGLENWESYIDMSNIQTYEEIQEAAAKYDIFGRVTPNQKKLLIIALKSQGRTVAMTGDGVNDVLALREADCSIAMGEGSDAARQVSQLVLINSDFSVMPNIVMEGRRVVNNITRSACVFFVKTMYSALLTIFSVLTLSAFPFIPVQITLIDAMVEGFPGVVLMLEPTHRRLKGKFLNTVIGGSLPYAILILIMFLTIKYISPVLGIHEDHAKTIIYYLTAFISILSLINSCKPFTVLRIAVCVTATAGLFGTAYLFSNIFSLVNLKDFNLSAFILLSGLFVLCIPLKILIDFVMRKIYRFLMNNFRNKFRKGEKDS